MIKLAHSLKSRGRISLFLLPLSTILLSSCASKVGSNMISASHGNYNRVISDIQREELLLNIVRRRYLEPAQFTSIGSISQSRSVSNGFNANLDFDVPKTGLLDYDGSVNDFPTYSLTPQSGPEATNALHTGIPLEVIPKLANAGYTVDTIFTLLARKVAGIRSADVCAGGGLSGGSSKFVPVLCAIKGLEEEDKLSIANALWEEKLFEHPFAPEVFSPEDIVSVQSASHNYTSTDDGQSFFVTSRTPQPIFWVSADARMSGEGRRLIDLLNLDPNTKKKGWALRNEKFVQGVEFADLAGKRQDHLTIETRSIYGVLNLLSLGVRVPACDYGKVSCSPGEYDEVVNCGKFPDIADDFVVHYSEECPECAFIAVPHRCGWYYIKDNDRCSKTYFNALYDLYNLAGPERVVSTNSTRIASPVLSVTR